MDYSKYANSQHNYPHYPYAQQHHQQHQQQYQQQQQQYHPQSQSQASSYNPYPAQFQQQQYHQQSQYQQTPPQIRNPFAAPAPAHSAYANHNASFDPDYEAQVAQWQSAYAPQEPAEKTGKNGKPESTSAAAATGAAASTAAGGVAGPARPGAPTTENPAGIAGITAGPTLPAAAEDEASSGGKKKTVVRKGGGQTWEDSTLLEWDPTQFRIMVGNLAGEVTDDSLAKAFAQYGVSKARVVRDKRTTKSRGYGFVSFTDGEMGFKAAREMTGKYIGSHPVTIQRSKTDLRPVMQKDRHNKGKFSRDNNSTKNNDNKQQKKQDDPLKAHTGAHIEKKPVRNINGMKMLG